MRFKDFYNLVTESLTLQDIVNNSNIRIVYFVYFPFFDFTEDDGPIGEFEVKDDNGFWPDRDYDNNGDEYAKTYYNSKAAFDALFLYINSNKLDILNNIKTAIDNIAELTVPTESEINHIRDLKDQRRKQLKYNTEYYVNKIIDRFSLIKDLPLEMKWTIYSSHPDHDINVFGVEINRASLMRYLVKPSLEADDDLSQLL